MTPKQIKHMVNRFLMWKLPPDFNPDGGISATRPNYAPGVTWEPSGTNLFDATQAEAMVRYMIEGMPPTAGYVTPTQDDATRDIMAKLSDLAIATENLAIVEPDGSRPSVLSIIRDAQAEIMRLRQVAPQPDAVPEGHVRWCIPVQRGEDGSIFIDGEQRVRGWFTRYPDHPVIATIIADMPLPSEPPEIKGKVKTP